MRSELGAHPLGAPFDPCEDIPMQPDLTWLRPTLQQTRGARPWIALLALAGLAVPGWGHGGQYRGPGDTVPPGGGGLHGGGGGNGAGPAGPAAPLPGLGGAGGRGPNGRPGIGARAGLTGGGDPSVDLTQWTFWWEFNREPYLDLKNAIARVGPLTGSEGWFLGKGQRGEARESVYPTEEQIRTKVVPALVAALEKETNNDVVTGCLIALAKIGTARSGLGAERIQELLARRLRSPVQEIAETAAVALGILGDDAVVPALAALLADDERGRALVGAEEVPVRTRAFAAYGLGLVGSRTEGEGVRLDAVAGLHAALASDAARSFDLGTACVVALGLVPLATLQPEDRAQASEKGAPPRARTQQIDALLALLDDREQSTLVRAHVPIAVCRLLRPGADGAARLPDALDATYGERVLAALLARLTGSERNEVVQSCVLALGLLADADPGGLDARARAALAGVPQDVADLQSRHYAMIAMAKAGARRGAGDRAAGLEEASSFLLAQLARGKSDVRPWAALAIGVLCRALHEEGVDTAHLGELKAALRSALREEKDDQTIGAYAIAAGLAADQESAAVLLERFERLRGDEARGYVAVALGLLGERQALPAIQRVVRESKYRPELLRQAAIALGLLGDQKLVDDLVVMLRDATSLASQSAIAAALGRIGDRRSIDPLVEMLANEDLSGAARGLAAAALGVVADEEDLPWNTAIGVDLNYRATAPTLNDLGGTGILNIL